MRGDHADGERDGTTTLEEPESRVRADCEQVAATDVVLFAYLVGNTPIRFDDLADLVSSLRSDEALFAQLNAAFGAFSSYFGDPIRFASPAEAIAAHASCELHALVDGLITAMND